MLCRACFDEVSSRRHQQLEEKNSNITKKVKL
jgi:hypothetical protein